MRISSSMRMKENSRLSSVFYRGTGNRSSECLKMPLEVLANVSKSMSCTGLHDCTEYLRDRRMFWMTFNAKSEVRIL